MATDFLEYSNLRLLIGKPALAPADFRNGVQSGTSSWIIHLFVKGQSSPSPSLPSITPNILTLRGYVTAWANLPSSTSWLAASTAFTWDESGLVPSGLLPGASGRGFRGNLNSLPTIVSPGYQGEATIVDIGGDFGPGGIGAELRSQLGDQITVELQFTA